MNSSAEEIFFDLNNLIENEKSIQQLDVSATKACTETIVRLQGNLDQLPPARYTDFAGLFFPFAIRFIQTKLNENEISNSLDFESSHHQLRLAIVSLLRLSCGLSDAIRPYLDSLVACILCLIKEDTFEVSVEAIQTYTEINKIFRGNLDSSVPSFLDFVLELTASFQESVQLLIDSDFSYFDNPNFYESPQVLSPIEFIMTAGRKRKSTSSQTSSITSMPKKDLSEESHVDNSKLVTWMNAKKTVRLLYETPATVVLLFQLHRKFISDYIPRFLPQIINLLLVKIPKITSIEIESKFRLAKQARLLDSSQTEIDKNNSFKNLLDDCTSTQIKTLSFLAYIVRGFTMSIREHRTLIPEIVIRLLQSCPEDESSLRKDLLIATRHILSTDVRQSFLPFIGSLIDEELLVGSGYTAHVMLRPIALSMLADLIHHMRLDIGNESLHRVIAIYTRTLHDPTLPISIQTMSVKLLLNLVDTVVSEKFAFDEKMKRGILFKILIPLMEKFDFIKHTVNEMISNQIQIATSKKNPSEETSDLSNESFLHNQKLQVSKNESISTTKSRSESLPEDLLEMRPLATDSAVIDSSAKYTNTALFSKDRCRELKFLFKTLISAVKNLLIAIRNVVSTGEPTQDSTSKNHLNNQTVNPQASNIQNSPTLEKSSQVKPVTLEECEMYFSRLFRRGLACFDLFLLQRGELPNSNKTDEIKPIEALRSSVNTPVAPEEKELMEQFGHLFTLIQQNSSNFLVDILSANMPYLILKTHENPPLLTIPQYFLAITGITRPFAALLVRSLMERFGDVGSAHPVTGAITLRMFKLLFLAVSVYPEENESILQPHLAEIILGCFRNYPQAAAPLNYLLLLRSLFRSIGGGRFDALYKEVLPLLQTILDELAQLAPLDQNQFLGESSHLLSSSSNAIGNKSILIGSQSTSLRDMYIELSLTTPVRLSNLLPYLSYLMRPVLLALQSGGDLVNQGLRTFELCIDNLTPDFLEPIMAPFFNDILAALCRMLQPAVNSLSKNSPSRTSNNNESQQNYTLAHAHTAARLLGKLGGKSRRPPIPSPSTHLTPNSKSDISFNHDLFVSKESLKISLITTSQQRISIPFDAPINAAIQVIISFSRPNASLGPDDLPILSEAVALINYIVADILLRVIPECSVQNFVNTEPIEVQNIREKIRAIGVRQRLLQKPKKDIGQIGKNVLPSLLGALWQLAISETSDEILKSYVTQSREMISAFYDILVSMSNSESDHLSHDNCMTPSTSNAKLFLENIIDFDAGIEFLVQHLTYEGTNLCRENFSWCIFSDSIGKVKASNSATETNRFVTGVSEKIVQACFHTHPKIRVSAAHLLERLCNLELGNCFILHYETRFLRGVLFVLKSLPTTAAPLHAQNLTKIVLSILRLASNASLEKISKESHRSPEGQFSDTNPTNAQSQKPTGNKLHHDQVMLALVTELSNPNGAVRDAVKASFNLISELQSVPITELLIPLRSRVIGPIFSKPLRALPLNVQVGYIDAITYCLSLKPPLLETSDDLLRLVNEALAVIEADDGAFAVRSAPPTLSAPTNNSMTGTSTVNPGTTSTSINNHNIVQSATAIAAPISSLSHTPMTGGNSVIVLRVVCIRLLSVCIGGSDFQSQSHLHPLRNQIVAVFFKLLYVRNAELVEAARLALDRVLAQQHKLPTELLQNGLRPVLQSLGEPRTLNITAVDGLRRILELFSHFFRAEIGKKLLEYLNMWCNDHLPTNQASNSTEKSTQVFLAADTRITVAIMELFSMLPSCGHLFMGDLIMVTIGIENVVQRKASSPFRPVLKKFMQKYPQDAINFFIERLRYFYEPTSTQNNLSLSNPLNNNLTNVMSNNDKSPTDLNQSSSLQSFNHSTYKPNDLYNLNSSIVALYTGIFEMCKYPADDLKKDCEKKLENFNNEFENGKSSAFTSKKLIVELTRAFDAISKTLLNSKSVNSASYTTRVNLLRIMHVFYSCTLHINPEVTSAGHIDLLTALWNNYENNYFNLGEIEKNLDTGYVSYLKHLCLTTMAFCESHPKEIKPAFLLQKTFSFNSPRTNLEKKSLCIMDISSRIPIFFCRWALYEGRMEQLKSILYGWLHLSKTSDVMLKGETPSIEQILEKTRMLKLIIQPLIHRYFASNNLVFGIEDILSIVDEIIWSKTKPVHGNESLLAVEELQLTALILKNISTSEVDLIQTKYCQKILAFLLSRCCSSLDGSVRFSALKIILEMDHIISNTNILSSLESSDLKSSKEMKKLDENGLVLFAIDTLIRSPAIDIRLLIKQCTDTLLPLIASESKKNELNDQHTKFAISRLTDALIKDGRNPSTTLVISLWQSAFTYRERLLPIANIMLPLMVVSFSRCSLSALNSSESRSATLGVCSTIIYWHKTLNSTKEDEMSNICPLINNFQKNHSPKSISPLSSSVQLVDLLINSLIRLISSFPDYTLSSDSELLVKKMIDTLGESLLLFAPIFSPLRLAPIERLFSEISNSNVNSSAGNPINPQQQAESTAMLITGLRILETIVTNRSLSQVTLDLPLIQRWLRGPILERINGRSMSAFSRLMIALNRHFGEFILDPLTEDSSNNEESDVNSSKDVENSNLSSAHDSQSPNHAQLTNQFVRFLRTTIIEGLNNSRNLGVYLAAIDCISSESDTMIKHSSLLPPLESLLPIFARAFQRAAREYQAKVTQHISSVEGSASESDPLPLLTFANISQRSFADFIAYILLPAIRSGTRYLLGLSSTKNFEIHVTENCSQGFRALFLPSMYLLWEGCGHFNILENILHLVDQWMNESTSLSVREVAEILLLRCKLLEQLIAKTVGFGALDGIFGPNHSHYISTIGAEERKILSLYLNTVYRVYNEAPFAKTELRSRMEGAFLVGLICEGSLPCILENKSGPSNDADSQSIYASKITSGKIHSSKRRFWKLLNASVSCKTASRMKHVFETQRWHLAGSTYWIPCAIDLLIGCCSISLDLDVLTATDKSSTEHTPFYDKKVLKVLKNAIGRYNQCNENCDFPSELTSSVSVLMHGNRRMAHEFSVQLIPRLWKNLQPKIREHLSSRLIRIFASDAYLCQAQLRPNAIDTLIECVSASSMLHFNDKIMTFNENETTDQKDSTNLQAAEASDIGSLNVLKGAAISVPPALVAYLARTYRSWYSCISYLEALFDDGSILTNSISTLEKKVYGSTHVNKKPTTKPWVELVTVLGSIYGALNESDIMHGVYRRGLPIPETNVAASFSQHDLWTPAQRLFESAMTQCRNGSLPYGEAEVRFWEDRWITSAKRLQQWDLLTDIARADGDAELGLECLWRVADWTVPETQAAAVALIRQCPEPNSRIKFLEAFVLLAQGSASSNSTPTNTSSGSSNNSEGSKTAFQGILGESLQLALSEWQELPSCVGPAHHLVLHRMQLIAEAHESLALYSHLPLTNSTVQGPKPQLLSDLKSMLTAWRERLPNRWDDLDQWSDVLAWRQHVFTAINGAFQPLITPPEPNTVSNIQPHPYAFRGYHEMAWLINRFALVARKNHLMEVCISFLNRIYTLPNIEIQDAFLKLREQTKCHMENPAELPTALEVVNATNLNYFSSVQKSEFFALRASILSRLGLTEEANRVFAQAVQIDLNVGHGWSAWGRFNDQRFTATQETVYAGNAINCYLQAATLVKVSRARRFLVRILWLLTFEDATGSLGKSFELNNNDLPTWSWVVFVPQLLSALSRKEQRQARFVLVKIAKSYPQALYLPLRIYHEDCRMQFGGRQLSNPRTNSNNVVEVVPQSIANDPLANVNLNRNSNMNTNPSSTVNSINNNPNMSPGNLVSNSGGTNDVNLNRKHPMECAEDLISVLKTGYPLLSLTMENVMEHIVHRLRSTVDEDFYRVLTSLIGEAYQHAMGRISAYHHGQILSGASTAPLAIEASLRRVYTMVCNSTSLAPLYKTEFERDFMCHTINIPSDLTNLSENHQFFKNEQDHIEYILEKLFMWRERLQLNSQRLNKRSKNLVLDGLSRFLAEFEYHRYDDVDIPGQYILLRDGCQDFVKIERFDARVAVVKRHGTTYRRLGVRGSDGKLYTFAVQNPAGRQARREERVLQLLRSLDAAMKRGVECRKRGLYLNVPVAISISAHVRLLADESSSITFEDILDEYCKTCGVSSNDQIFLHFRREVQKLFHSDPHQSSKSEVNFDPDINGRTGTDPIESINNDSKNSREKIHGDNNQTEIKKIDEQGRKQTTARVNVELLNIQTDVFTDISSTMVPKTVLRNYMQRLGVSPEDHWVRRRDFTRQFGTFIFQDYILSIGHRFLHKIAVSTSVEKMLSISQTELLPMVTSSGQISLIEIVPFRYTPNIQEYVTPIGTEGPLLSSIVACSRSLAKADSDLADFLTIFVRDELLLWYINYFSMNNNPAGSDSKNANTSQPPGIIGEILESPLERLEAAGIDEKAFFGRVQQNCELILKRTQTLSCIREEEQHITDSPIVLFQAVLDLLSSASNPQKLAQMDPHWHPWF